MTDKTDTTALVIAEELNEWARDYAPTELATALATCAAVLLKKQNARIAELEALQAAPPAPAAVAVPEGWVLVPVNPTAEMCKAANWSSTNRQRWADMIAVVLSEPQAHAAPNGCQIDLARMREAALHAQVHGYQFKAAGTQVSQVIDMLLEKTCELATARAALAAAPAQAWPSECDSPELCQVHRGCAGQYGTKNTCPSFAALNPCNSAAPAQAVAVPIELQGVKEAAEQGSGFWRSCTGCHELNEGHDTGPVSKVFGCALGNGCSECGGIGAVWDDLDYGAMAVAMVAPAQAVVVPAEVELPDVEDMAHSAVQEALSFGVNHDVFHRWMRAVMDKTVQALAAGAAQAPEQWIDDPHDIEQGRMLNPEWVRAQEHANQLAGQTTISVEPDAWAAVVFGGKRNGKIYSTCDTQPQCESYIGVVEQSNDSITLVARPVFLGAAPAQAQEDARDLEAEALRACRDLPEGWEIEIHLERGYGVVTVIDPQGNDDELPVEGTLFDALKETIDTAIRDDAARAAPGGEA